jgi:hypothetical protein
MLSNSLLERINELLPDGFRVLALRFTIRPS